MKLSKVISENIFIRIFKLIITISSAFFLYNYFLKNSDIIFIKLNLNFNFFFFVCLFTISNISYSFAWATNINSTFNLNKYESFTVSMKSYIGKYAGIKIGSYVIKFSQNIKTFNKKDFIKLSLFEQFITVLIGLTFGVFYFYAEAKSNLAPLVLILATNFILFFIYIKVIKNLDKLLSNITSSIPIYFVSSSYLFFVITKYAQSLNFENFIYFGAIYFFVSAISVIVSIVPAGLGVKEAMLIFLLDGLIEESLLLNVLIELRIIFVLADIFSWMLGNVLSLVSKKGN
mgnify:FL=1